MIKRTIKIGKGKLPEFEKEYNELSNKEMVTVKASQLFPMLVVTKEENDYVQMYEYVIYYEEIIKEEPRLVM